MRDSNPTYRSQPWIGDRARALAGCVLIAALLVCAPPAVARKNIDRIYAVIGTDIVTHSDVLTMTELLSRTRTSILPADEIFAPGTKIEFNKRALKEAVIRRLIYPEAVNLKLVDVPDEDVQAAYDDLVATFDSRREFAWFCFVLGLRDEQMRFLLRQYLVCESYIAKKIGLQVRISLKTYFEEHRDRYGEVELDDVKKRVEADLYREKLDEWFREILGRSDVRIIDDDYADALQ